MLEVEEHGEKTLTKTCDILVLQKFGVVLVIFRQLQPPKEIVQSRPVLLECEPNTDEDQIVVITVSALFLTRSLVDWMASAIDCELRILALLKTIVREQGCTYFADF